LNPDREIARAFPGFKQESQQGRAEGTVEIGGVKGAGWVYVTDKAFYAVTQKYGFGKPVVGRIGYDEVTNLDEPFDRSRKTAQIGVYSASETLLAIVESKWSSNAEAILARIIEIQQRSDRLVGLAEVAEVLQEVQDDLGTGVDHAEVSEELSRRLRNMSPEEDARIRQKAEDSLDKLGASDEESDGN
jgi:hypothetical protein